ncbi:LOW QUALITY PROTEIN: uncharacterized protein LOC120281264 [Dioscorea cayenensis subsp. rotundata]|uniref:LOW QUALITY PROTEIN: uncharacterized protein LOC120281264 n=1 Tax=Dioscorea cayennensis subsp. rotundata TaxID=55577 RepID=A0AB40CZT2_DIOCR|nr:LOW QUALITY PROTEIN: uncharacterized protein LOC120281264 [Dioscorea cayenensis subsp. rotundata]
MVGRGSRKDDLPNLSSTNGFAALESLKKKKKSDNSKSKGLSKNQAKEPEKPVFWAPAPITSKKWADVEDEDDDDYYATTAPLNEGWGLPAQQQTKEDDVLEEGFGIDWSSLSFDMCDDVSVLLVFLESVCCAWYCVQQCSFQGVNCTSLNSLQETESEDDDIGIDNGDDDVEDEVENEPKAPVPAEPGLKKPLLAASATKETERQLSKKELKKKENEEFHAILNELGISSIDNNAEQGVTSKKTDGQNGENEKKDNAPAASESKISKKKKAKKDKSSREAKDSQEQPNGGDTNTPDEVSGTQPADKDAPAVDVKEKIKKVGSIKKKKSSKEMDPAAKAAAQEVATRNARLAATSKRKDKNHYNQQPIR